MMDRQNPLLRGRHILVVEDDFFVGQALSSVLELAGAMVIGPIGWLDEAVQFLAANRGRIDAAVLDVDLHGQKSYPIADMLGQSGIPFVFATGYGAESLAPEYVEHARVEKPFDHDKLIEKLAFG